MGSDRTNWQSVAMARSYVPAGESVSGVDVECAIYQTFTATILFQMYSPCLQAGLASISPGCLTLPCSQLPSTTDLLHIVIYPTPVFVISGCCQLSLSLGGILKLEHTLGGAD